MKAYIWALPPAVFGLWALVWLWRYPSFLRDPSIVRNPRKRAWHMGRFLDDEEWTEQGRRVRWQFARHVAIGLLLAAAAIGVAGYLETRL